MEMFNITLNVMVSATLLGFLGLGAGISSALELMIGPMSPILYNLELCTGVSPTPDVKVIVA
jgi:hypothetical protein